MNFTQIKERAVSKALSLIRERPTSFSNRNDGGWPVPPPPLIFKVIGTEDVQGFLDSGAGHARLIREMLERNGARPEEFRAILDFGCGVARLLRHFTDFRKADLYGTDYNPELIAWCQNQLPFARFDVNKLVGGLAHENEKFDLIYLLSVFTHLDEAQQLFWMDEFARVLKPGGYLYFTMHSTFQFSPRTPEEAAQYANNQLVVRMEGEAGSNMVNTFASREYVEAKLTQRFSMLDYAPGGNLADWKTAEFQPQDSYLLRKRDT